MKSLKTFSTGGVSILPAQSSVYFAGAVTFQNIAPLLLKKVEFNVIVTDNLTQVNKPVQMISGTLSGRAIQFQNPVSGQNTAIFNTLDFKSVLQSISEEYDDGIFFAPSDVDTSAVFSFAILNNTPYVAGDNLTWFLRLHFLEIEEKKINEDLFTVGEKIDLSQFYPLQ